MNRYRHATLVLSLVVILTFPVHNTQAFGGTFTKLWCNVTSLFGFPCEIQTENVTPVESKETATVLPPPALSVPSNNYETVNAVTEEVTTSTTVIEEHNTYPTTVVYEKTDRNLSDYEILSLFLKLTKLMNSSVNSSVTSRDEGDEIDSELFFKQVDKIFERTGESNNNVQENVDALTSALDASITTGILTVSGNTDVGGDLTVDGSITAGILNVSALSSAGALIAPYFTATSTTATSSFMGAVGIGTTTPSSKLTVAGDINISDTTTGYKLGNNRILYASSTNFSTLVGIGTGNALLSDGLYNTALGHQSLYTATSSDYNTAVGYHSLYSNTTGSYNTANGVQSLYFNTTGTSNTTDGFQSLVFNTTGSDNTASGYRSMYSNTTGNYNTANGRESLYFNTTGTHNVAYGHSALLTNTTGSYNTANGYGSLFSNTGSENTALGFNSGRYLADSVTSNATSSRSIFLGTNTKALTAGDQNAIVIGYDANGLGSNSVVLGNDSIVTTALKGKVGIGTTTPSAKLTVTQSAQTATGGFWLSTSDNTDFRSQFMDTSGVLSFYGGDTAGTLNTATLNAAGEWTNASDISYKENIEKLSNGLDIALALKPRTYDIKNTDNHRIGFIAQEVEEVIPEVVSGKDGAKGISYGNLVAVAISAIQELAEKVSGFANLFKSERIETNTLCVGNTCVTETELQELLQDKLEQSKSGNKSESSTNTDTSSSESTVEIEPVATSTDNLSVELEESVSEDLIVDDFEVEIVEDLPVDEIIEENSVTNLEN